MSRCTAQASVPTAVRRRLVPSIDWRESCRPWTVIAFLLAAAPSALRVSAAPVLKG